ncbi:hypothetical protein DENIS_3072 [Desulfonema ishimotonii]|uniref:DUF2059 domain-containing protein n=1 Tax=Desulfonema ishimotonii TaxID=45657 RepID=A0A401FYR7_9BACT|nr:DUF2059 domain-containing protein [Desulfonema ishimotonii]GBC62109.1 hypothetical protein DENIS_3072 [Desulfonema ishimotonii]
MRPLSKAICASLIFILIIVSTSVFGDQNSKAAKLNELMELSGMVKIMEKARNKNKVQALQYKQQVMKQFEQNFNIDDPKVWKYFESEYQKFIASLEPKWSSEEAVQKYADLYGSRMTEEEIDKVLEFEKSEVGKKSTAVSNEVVPLWLDYLTKESDAQFSEGLQKFAANLKSFIAEKNKKQKIQKELQK